MPDQKPLHIYITPKMGQNFHEDIGWLELNKADSFDVSIKEFHDEKVKLDSKLKADKDSLDKKRKDHLDRIIGEQSKSYEFITQNHKDYNEGKISESTYDANVEARNKSIEERKQRLEKINSEYSNKVKELNSTYETDLKKIKEGYSKVRWVWQLVGDKRPQLNKDSFNEAVAIGRTDFSLTFKDFLEGGGATYLEPFWEGTSPIGKYPHGVLINAKGTQPDILSAEWTDANNNTIQKTLKFGSTVYLNIYTSSLYGHNIKVQLKDKDKVLRILTLGITNADDKLFAAEYLNNDLENRTEEDITNKDPFFERPVSVYPESSAPSDAKIGYILAEDDNQTDGKTTSKPNVQKSKFAVFVDPIWQSLAGSSLDIYPIVYKKGIPNGKIEFPSTILKIDANSKEEIKVEEITSNQVAVVSSVETNLQHFSPCGYDTITAIIKNIEYPIFKRKTSEIDKTLRLELISDGKNENLFVYIPDLETKECTYNNKIEYHTGKVIGLKNPEINYPNLKKDEDSISFDVNYPKPTTEQIIDYAWLPNVKPKKYELSFTTCRFHHPLVIDVYPNVQYHFNANIGVSEDKYLYVIQSKNYKKRKYKANKGSDTKAARKAYNKQQKQKFTEDVDNEVTGENFKKEYEFSIEFEASFAEEKTFAIEGSSTKLEDIIEKAMYIYGVIDSYVGGSAMKEAENKPETKEKFKEDKKKRENKRKTDKSKLPLRFEVSPPKFTGGVAWKYANSTKEPNRLGVEYEFKLGALPLIEVTGRLDLLFAAQFIPYINGVVKILDNAVATISQAGKFMQIFGIGNMEADYYFDFVSTTKLNIDFVNGAKYHTIDGYSGSEVGFIAEIEMGLEAGGYIKVELFDIVGEASIHAEAKAKFKFTWTPEKAKYVKFEFEGVEALIYGKIKVETKGGEDTEVDTEENPNITVEQKNEKNKKFDDVEIFKPFDVDIKIFD